MLLWLTVSTNCLSDSRVPTQSREDTVKVTSGFLQDVLIKLEQAKTNDTLLAKLQNYLKLSTSIRLQQDSLLVMQDTVINRYKSIVATFNKDLTKKRPWYDNVYVGVAVGVLFTYVAIEAAGTIKAGK